MLASQNIVLAAVQQASLFTVQVSNIGSVYVGYDEKEAMETYREYVALSKENEGRAAGETVCIFRDHYIYHIYEGWASVEN